MLYPILHTCKAGILNEAHHTWKMDLVKWAVNKGTHFQLSESSVSILISQLELYIKTPMMQGLELRALLDLLTLLPGRDTYNCIRSMVTSLLLDDENPKDNYVKTWANTAWAIGECLSFMTEVEGIHLDEGDIRTWIHQSLSRWYWSESVMKPLASLARKQ